MLYHRYRARTVSGDQQSDFLSLDVNARFGWAMAILLGMGIMEIASGLVAPSVPLLLSGLAVGALMIARRLATRPATGRNTFGLRRIPQLAQLVIATVRSCLVVVAAIVSIRQLLAPTSADGSLILVSAITGACALTAAMYLLSSRADFSMVVALGQVRTELYLCGIAALSGGLMLLTDWKRIDPASGLAAALLVLNAARLDCREAGHVLLDAAPPSVDPSSVGHTMASEVGVVEVHDLHVWSIAAGELALSAHVVTRWNEDISEIRYRIANHLRDRFGIHHATLQVERFRPTPEDLDERTPRGMSNGRGERSPNVHIVPTNDPRWLLISADTISGFRLKSDAIALAKKIVAKTGAGKVVVHRSSERVPRPLEIEVPDHRGTCK